MNINKRLWFDFNYLMNNDRKIFLLNFFQPMDIDKKYAGILEKKWTSVIRLQKKVSLTHKLLLVEQCSAQR